MRLQGVVGMACGAILLAGSVDMFANPTEADSILRSIDQRMELLDSLIFAPSAETAPIDVLKTKIDAAPDSAYWNALDVLTDARIAQIKGETGLQVTGQTYYRLDDAMGMDEEDAVSPYKGKIQIEARWYFLQSGLLKKKGRINELNLKADLDRLEHEKGRSEPALYAQRERLRVVSDSILASIMLHRVDNLNLLEQAYTYLLGNQNISGENLLKILDDRAEAERRLSTVSTEPTRALSLGSVTAGTVKIDTVAILSALKATDIDLQILDLKSKIIDQQADNTTWWSDVRLAPFVRYSHYFRHSMGMSANVDAGLSFTVPINTEASRKRTAMRAEKDLLVCAQEDLVAKAADRIRYISLETERLNRALAGEWSHAQTLRNYLQVRRNAYNNRVGEYNRVEALAEYNNYIKCLENIVDMQYRRDCLIADLQALIPTVPVLNYCTFTPLTK